MVDHGLSGLPAAQGFFPQISGFRVTYSLSASPGSRVQSLTLDDNTPIDDNTTYTLSLPDFINNGGDGYTMLGDGKGTTRELMAAVVLDHIVAQGTITPLTDGRITALP